MVCLEGHTTSPPTPSCSVHCMVLHLSPVTHTHTHAGIISRLAPVSLTSSGKRCRFSRSLFRRRYALECIPPTGLSFIYGLSLASSGSLFKICYFSCSIFRFHGDGFVILERTAMQTQQYLHVRLPKSLALSLSLSLSLSLELSCRSPSQVPCRTCWGSTWERPRYVVWL